MKQTLALILIFTFLQSSAQLASNPCGFPDTMEYHQLIKYSLIENNYIDRYGEVYREVKDEKDLLVNEEEPIAHFDNVNLMIYARNVSGNVFDGLTFVIKNSKNWQEWDIELSNTNLDSMRVYRPDAARFPHIIAIRYRSAHGSGMGSYDEIRYQYWDVKKLAFMGEFKAYTYSFGRSEDMQTNITTSSIYTSTRRLKFENGELSIDTTHVAESVTKIKSMKNNSEKLDKKLENYKCDPVTYAIKNGQFVRIDKK